MAYRRPHSKGGRALSDRADALGVPVQQVSGDKNSEYPGISAECAQRILDALGVRFRLEVEEPIPEGDNDQEKVPAERKRGVLCQS